jgi:Ca2+-binding EF-hand superfamily protein
MMAADANKDGKVSLDEMKTVAPNMTPEKFKALDRNGDGFVTKEDRSKGPKDGKGGIKAGRGPANGQGKPGANFAERMKKADANSDGKVTFEEMKTGSPRLTQERFNMMDKNKDGFISPEDRPAKANNAAPAAGAQTNDPAAKKALARAKGREALVKADANKDGKVSMDELQQTNPKVTPEKFKKMDKNGDGFITKEDRKQKPAV